MMSERGYPRLHSQNPQLTNHTTVANSAAPMVISTMLRTNPLQSCSRLMFVLEMLMFPFLLLSVTRRARRLGPGAQSVTFSGLFPVTFSSLFQIESRWPPG